MPVGEVDERLSDRLGEQQGVASPVDVRMVERVVARPLAADQEVVLAEHHRIRDEDLRHGGPVHKTSGHRPLEFELRIRKDRFTWSFSP